MRSVLLPVALATASCSFFFDPISPPVEDAPASDSLVEEGLVVRYYLDDELGATEVGDSAPSPLPLALRGSAILVGDSGRRGLQFTPRTDAKATAPIAGTKVERALEDATAATIELVLEVMVPVDGAHPLWIGSADDPGSDSLGIRLDDDDECNRTSLVLNGNARKVTWPDELAGARKVVHLILNTTELEVEDRARLLVGGERRAACAGAGGPNRNDTIANVASSHLSLGNQAGEADSFGGILYYAALYSVALTDVQIQQNLTILLDRDDR